MNVELYIAKKILPHKSNANISKPIVRIAKIAIALGLAVMIIAISVIIGFKSTISEKLFGFSSHIQIVNFDANNSFETIPITKDSVLFAKLQSQEYIKHVEYFATKPAIIKGEKSVKGVIVKGIDSVFDWSFFNAHLIAGTHFSLSHTITDSVLISNSIAKLLNVSVNDSFITTFVPNKKGKRPRKRQFIVAGIYETNLQEIDDRYIVADMRHIQSLNYWNADQVSGYEVFINNRNTITTHKANIRELIGFNISEEPEYLYVRTLRETNPQIFDWLSLLDMNAWIIIILMILVAGMNMITGLLVIILEKTNVIGILKTLGAHNHSVQKIFLYVGSAIITKGIIWGNIIGLLICTIQYFFHIIPLDPEIYFMSYVPISFPIVPIILINIGTVIITICMLLLPALIISKINPAYAVKFE
ncbi:MAG: FtsX-like permease family protein [Bacteroidales bacterium]